MAPGINLQYNPVAPGQKMICCLFGWAPDQPISLNIPNVTSLPSVLVDGSGNAQFAIQIPTNTIPGSYQLTAHNSSDNTSAQGNFTVSNLAPTIYPLCVFANYEIPLYSVDPATNLRSSVSFTITNIGNETCSYALVQYFGNQPSSRTVQTGNLNPAQQIIYSSTLGVGSVIPVYYFLQTTGVVSGTTRTFTSCEVEWFMSPGAPPSGPDYVTSQGIQGSSLSLVNPINSGSGGTRTDLSILVSDKTTNQPIPNANVTLTGGMNVTGTTGAQGIFESIIPQGTYAISVTAANYGQFSGSITVSGSTQNFGVQLVANTSGGGGGGGTGGGITGFFSTLLTDLQKNPLLAAVAAGLVVLAVGRKTEKKHTTRVVRA